METKSELKQPRTSLRALVQGLGIQLPAEPQPQKHKKSSSTISIIVKPRPTEPASPKRVTARPVTSLPRALSPRAMSPRALSPRALSPRALSPRPGGRTGSPKGSVRNSSPRDVSPRALSPRALSPRKSITVTALKRPPGVRTGSPRANSPTILRSPRATSPVRSPRALSPRMPSPRTKSPFDSSSSQRTASPVSARTMISPRGSIDSTGKKSRAKPKAAAIVDSKLAKKVSFVGITPGKLQITMVRKDEAPQPPPLTPQVLREMEASKAMVSPRIEFDASRTPSPPPKTISSKPLKPILRASKARDSNLLTSLITKIDNTASPNEAGLSKAELITRKHLYQTFRGLKMARSLPFADLLQIQAKRVVLMKPPGKFRRKTAIFDLDETLVHCLDHMENAQPDVVLPIRFPNGEIVHVRST